MQESKSWDDVKLLTVKVDRLPQWYRPGLLCIGDAAHAMSPVGGVGINLAVQDAVAAANLLAAPLRAGTSSDDDLAAVQRRRMFPTRATQRMQVFMQNNCPDPRAREPRTPTPPWPVRLSPAVPMLQRIPARLVGIGVRPEHVLASPGQCQHRALDKPRLPLAQFRSNQPQASRRRDVLSAEKNKIITQVGPGTPMGDYLRRYWHPIGGASELDTNPIKAMRLFGEDLVLYKDLGGKYGLIDRNCPHRRADLSYGFVEETGIRCNYHGWLMDQRGNVIEQPYDDTVNPRGKARERCLAKAYPVKECAGLLFAYMGPQPAPELPVWEPFTWENGFREVVISDIPCNWFQCQENSCDPVHFEWMHENWNVRLKGETAPMRPSISSWCSRSSTTASSTSACARARRTAIRSGPSAA